MMHARLCVHVCKWVSRYLQSRWGPTGTHQHTEWTLCAHFHQPMTMSLILHINMYCQCVPLQLPSSFHWETHKGRRSASCGVGVSVCVHDSGKGGGLITGGRDSQKWNFHTCTNHPLICAHMTFPPSYSAVLEYLTCLILLCMLGQIVKHASSPYPIPKIILWSEACSIEMLGIGYVHGIIKSVYLCTLDTIMTCSHPLEI